MAELDSHADTCLFGKDALLLYLTDDSVDVSVFHPSLETLSSVAIASVALAYDDLVPKETWILEFNQVLYAKDLHLIIPLQMNGVWSGFEF
jgi:hypothetical protein